MVVVHLMGTQNDASQSEKQLIPSVWYLRETRASTNASRFFVIDKKPIKLLSPWQQSGQCFLVNLPHRGGPVQSG